jgi:alpha-beta hydrolase superfamily lysophospholipase
MNITREEGAVTQRAVPGPALYYTAAVPEKRRAMVGIIHGYHEHGARYTHVMDAWAEEGIGSVALDLRGHGRATGTRGYVARFDEYLDDAAELARLTADRANGAPLYLFGHSFGGLVAAASILDAQRSWRGVVLSAPFLGLAIEVPRLKLAFGELAAKIVPKLGIPSGLKGSQMTHDAARARAYEEDPLVFKEVRARWFSEITRAQARTVARATELALPLYVAMGTDDPVVKMSTVRAFFDGASSKEKHFAEWPGLFHEVLNELSWKEVAAGMAEWIKKER